MPRLEPGIATTTCLEPTNRVSLPQPIDTRGYYELQSEGTSPSTRTHTHRESLASVARCHAVVRSRRLMLYTHPKWPKYNATNGEPIGGTQFNGIPEEAVKNSAATWLHRNRSGILRAWKSALETWLMIMQIGEQETMWGEKYPEVLKLKSIKSQRDSMGVT